MDALLSYCLPKFWPKTKLSMVFPEDLAPTTSFWICISLIQVIAHRKSKIQTGLGTKRMMNLNREPKKYV